MSVTVSPRLGVYQWSADTDEFSREQLNDSLASLASNMLGFLQGTTRPKASLALRGYLFFNESANTFSYCDGTQWWSIAGGETFGSPSSLTITSTASDGVLEQVVRSDHIHGLPGFGSALAIALSPSSGTGALSARSNHIHTLAAGVINVSTLFVGGVVDETAIADNAVSSAKIQTSAVTESKIADGEVGTSNIASGAVTESKIQDGAASGDKIANLSATGFTSGVFATAQIPSLDATKFTSGKFSASVLPAEVPSDPANYPIQPGQVVFYPYATAPEGYLLCDGQAVTSSSHPDLHAVLSAASYPYGVNGASAFVPDLRGRFPLGQAASGTGATLGASGGSLSHTHTGPSHTHDVNPPSTNTDSFGSHAHTIPSTASEPNHTHSNGTTSGHSVDSEWASDGSSGLVSKTDIDHSHSYSDTSSSAGSHTHPQPYEVSSGSHSHSVSDTTTSHTAPANSHDHTHGVGNTGSDGSHSHSVGNTSSEASHTHSFNLGAFTSGADGTGATGSALVPYIALVGIIKT